MADKELNRKDIYELLQSIVKDNTSKQTVVDGTNLLLSVTNKLNKYFDEHVNHEYGFQIDIVKVREKTLDKENENETRTDSQNTIH